MRIWIDFANSPHPLLFAPVVRRLAGDGHHVLLTARDHAQTVELTRERWPDTSVIGGQSARAKTAKARAIAGRVSELRRWAAAAKPDVALSHNSYAQIVAARSLRIPAVTAMDFEHQPANHLAFRLASTIVVPEVLPVHRLRSQGARAHKLVRYPGLKEQLYIGDFEPDPQIVERLGLSPRPAVIAVLRTPPTRAVYHPRTNPLFDAVLHELGARREVACVVLARHPEQLAALETLGIGNCLVPPAAIDARSLLYAADLVVGAGGTMTREAALMGIPTWTLFAGRTPAVDTWLESRQMLARLRRASELRQVGPRAREPRSIVELRESGKRIEQALVQAVLTAGRPGSAVCALSS